MGATCGAPPGQTPPTGHRRVPGRPTDPPRGVLAGTDPAGLPGPAPSLPAALGRSPRRAGSRARRWPRTNSLRESSSRSSSATLSRCAGGSGHGSGSTPVSGAASIAALRGGSRTRPAQPGLEPAASDASGPAQAQPGQPRPAPTLKGPRRPALAGGTDGHGDAAVRNPFIYWKITRLLHDGGESGPDGCVSLRGREKRKKSQ